MRISLSAPALAAARGLTRRQTAELAVGWLQAAEAARCAGLHVGAVADREALARVIVPRTVPV